MPIDYKKYPANWKSEIRPSILERAGNCCEFCKVENHKVILRGFIDGSEVYCDQNCDVYDASTSEELPMNWDSMVMGDDAVAIKVVLTIAHLDHDITNNEPDNLKALCQRCHNRHDAKHRKRTRASKKAVAMLV